MKLWFFVGDTIAWLASKKRPTGVHKVTLELFSCAMRQCTMGAALEVIACVLHEEGGLAAVSPQATNDFFTRMIDHVQESAIGKEDTDHTSPVTLLPGPSTSCRPQADDQVLFTGAVWTQSYVHLFRDLHSRGVRISVLIYDIIPVEMPELVGDAYYNMFSEWLDAVVSLASVILVSSSLTRDKIIHWAERRKLQLNARIVPISFGTIKLEPFASAQELSDDRLLRRIRLKDFVLSVGTVDRRKNQALLLRIWARLVAETGGSGIPQLVLAGRDDLEIAHGEAAPLVRSGHVAVIDGPPDKAVAGLYRLCLFTIFPSLSEGYGLPVAESLSVGKLCLCSNLPVIKEFAADMVWYFEPREEASAYELIRLAIERSDLRAAAESLIKQRFTSSSWTETLQSVIEAMTPLSVRHLSE